MGTNLARPDGAKLADFQDDLNSFTGNNIIQIGPLAKAYVARDIQELLPYSRRIRQAARPHLRSFNEAPDAGVWMESAVAATARVLTPEGAVPAGQLGLGDMVETKDHGAQPIRWIGQTRLTRAQLSERPALCPVRIKAGLVDGTYPRTDMEISPSAGIVMRSNRNRTDERLVQAAALTRRDGFCKSIPRHGITYVQLLLEHHAVLMVEGLEMESFHPGNLRPNKADAAMWSEVMGAMPDLEHDLVGYGPRVRPDLSDRARP
ncbi:Hint domain-containing protein [Vannielia sp.]|uniref:Hint domain-containing protein n=1 Tax=Vannielia sp. TaxID=2813045 RepID=UPI002612C34B|nr:Hint domain-containing protein [Vannielia sp.]MDF1873212.1 Hint domain-containing protein [Vannielia sp.]